jgi:hypothetical protein
MLWGYDDPEPSFATSLTTARFLGEVLDGLVQALGALVLLSWPYYGHLSGCTFSSAGTELIILHLTVSIANN